MNKVQIQWIGKDEAENLFKRASKEATKVAEGLLKNHTEELKAKAVSKAPVDTGFLKDNITTSHNGGESEVISGAGYSGFVEWGTRYMGAQPFMRPALMEQSPLFVRDLQDAVKGLFK